MGIYITQIALIILLPIVFSRIKDGKKLYCYTAAIILLCVIGFRTENMGLYDVKNIYFPQFDSLQRMTMAEMFKEYPVMRGNLFQIFTKLYQVFSENKYVWLFFTSIPYIAAMAHSIKKYSLNVYTCSFCFFMICGMRIYQTNFYLIRHSIAMAILTALGVIPNEEIIRYMILGET